MQVRHLYLLAIPVIAALVMPVLIIENSLDRVANICVESYAPEEWAGGPGLPLPDGTEYYEYPYEEDYSIADSDV